MPEPDLALRELERASRKDISQLGSHGGQSPPSRHNHFLARRVYAPGIRIQQGGLVLDRGRVLLASPTVGRVPRYTLNST